MFNVERELDSRPTVSTEGRRANARFGRGLARENNRFLFFFLFLIAAMPLRQRFRLTIARLNPLDARRWKKIRRYLAYATRRKNMKSNRDRVEVIDRQIAIQSADKYIYFNRLSGETKEDFVPAVSFKLN